MLRIVHRRGLEGHAFARARTDTKENVRNWFRNIQWSLGYLYVIVN